MKNDINKIIQDILISDDFIEKESLIKKGQIIDENNPKLNKIATNYYFYNHKYNESIQTAEKALENIKKYDLNSQQKVETQIELIFFLANSLYYKHEYEQAEQNFNQLLGLILKANVKKIPILAFYQAETKQKLNFLDQKKNNAIQISVVRRQNEGKEFTDIIKDCQTKQYMSQHGFYVYIISQNWFKQWKKYVLLKDDEQEENSHIIENSENNKFSFPGPVDNFDILDYKLISTTLFKDPDKVKEYQNWPLRKQFSENKHFVILPGPAGDFLFKKYSCNQKIKRLILNTISQELSQVEIHLVQVNFIVFPLLNPQPQNKYISTFISKQENIHLLKQKIIRIIKSINPNLNLIKQKLWKLPTDTEIPFIYDLYQNKENSCLLINAEQLNSDQNIEDIEILEKAIFLFEFIENNQTEFIFTNDHQTINMKKCGFCKEEQKQLCLCQCRLITYCDIECLRKHRPKHKQICKQNIKTTQIILKKEQKISSEEKRQGLCGLQNIGNTCFMNSSLQCLSNVQELTLYMLQNTFQNDINYNNPLGTGGQLVQTYAELIKNMWNGTNTCTSPWNLKKVLSKFAPQFLGYSQQDSQELLSYLLDGLHEDLNQIKKKPFVQQIESDGKNDHEVAQMSWDNYLKRNKSIIVDLMVGQFKSTLNCPKCQKISVTFDPFMSVSVPIPFVQYIKQVVYYFSFDKVPVLYSFKIQSNSKVSDLINKIKNKLQKNNLILYFIDEKKQVNHFDSLNDPFSKYLQGNIFFVQERNQENEIEIRIQIIDKIKPNQNEQNLITFERLTYVNKNSTSYKSIHLQVWTIFRLYMAIIIEQLNRQSKIDMENNTNSQIQDEFEYYFQTKNQSHPYLLIDDQQNKITFEENKFLFQDHKKQTKNIIYLLPQNLYLQNSQIFNKYDTQRDQNQEEEESKEEERKTNLYDCLNLFIKEEVLQQGNEWYCNVCKEHIQANKKMEIYKTPKILIIHLKRFKMNRYSSVGTYYYASAGQKLDEFIDFPISDFDLSEYILQNIKGEMKKQITYELFAVVNHFGNANGGHYTAYCKNFFNQKWYDFNDSNVQMIEQQKIISSAAYLLFYRLKQ